VDSFKSDEDVLREAGVQRTMIERICQRQFYFSFKFNFSLVDDYAP